MGVQEFELVGEVTHSLRLGYQLNLTKNFGVTTRASYGFSPFAYGMFITKNVIKDSDSPLESAFYSWWSVNGFAEFGIKNDCFYEFGFE